MPKPSLRESAQQRQLSELHECLLKIKIVILDVGSTIVFVWLVVHTLMQELR